MCKCTKRPTGTEIRLLYIIAFGTFIYFRVELLLRSCMTICTIILVLTIWRVAPLITLFDSWTRRRTIFELFWWTASIFIVMILWTSVSVRRNKLCLVAINWHSITLCNYIHLPPPGHPSHSARQAPIKNRSKRANRITRWRIQCLINSKPTPGRFTRGPCVGPVTLKENSWHLSRTASQ